MSNKFATVGKPKTTEKAEPNPDALAALMSGADSRITTLTVPVSALAEAPVTKATPEKGAKLTFVLSQEDWLAFKIHCAANKISGQKLVSQLVHGFLAKKQK